MPAALAVSLLVVAVSPAPTAPDRPQIAAKPFGLPFSSYG